MSNPPDDKNEQTNPDDNEVLRAKHLADIVRQEELRELERERRRMEGRAKLLAERERVAREDAVPQLRKEAPDASE